MPTAIQELHSPPTGVLLVGHGTRSEVGRTQCRALANEVASGLDKRSFASELAYLELASPTIEEGVRQLIGKKIERLVVVPLLLFAAGHAKADIPTAVRNALTAAGSPNLLLLQTEPLGVQEPVLELAAERFREATDSRISPADTCLLLIGRGSRDEGATAEMRKLGSLLRVRLGVGGLEVGFLSMAEPRVDAIIPSAKTSPYHQIIVQPHLLFHGDLLDRLQQQVSAAESTATGQTWRMSRVLGTDTTSLSQILQQSVLAIAGEN